MKDIRGKVALLTGGSRGLGPYVAHDLGEMRALGLNTVRFFLMTADFADAEGNLRPDALEKLDSFLALCREQELMTLPTFFVGHMSGASGSNRRGRDRAAPFVLHCRTAESQRTGRHENEKRRRNHERF